MKLKKIASLMLAGVLAVSMLAGCGDNDKKDPASSEDTSAAAGYSAMLGDKAADTLKKSDLDKVVTFADSADDQKALAAAVLGVSDKTLATWIKGNELSEVTADDCAGKFEDKADLNRQIKTAGNSGDDFFKNDSMNTTKIGQVWVANSGYTLDQVMSEIFEEYKDGFEGLEDKATINDVKVNYNYTVSVSVVNKAEASDTMLDGSVNFVAVTVTRTAEIA